MVGKVILLYGAAVGSAAVPTCEMENEKEKGIRALAKQTKRINLFLTNAITSPSVKCI